MHAFQRDTTGKRESSSSLLETSKNRNLSTQHRRPLKKLTQAFITDTWIPEVGAILLSIACSVAIGILLAVWSGHQVPHLAQGVTVNAVISVLSTTSKSAMLYVVTACIAQIKWIWFRRTRPLAKIQIFDDASRGPLGAIYMLIDRRILSVASLGALITILALAFDPFIQQALVFPLQPLATQSPDAIAKQALSSFGTENFYLSEANIRKALSEAYWADGFNPQLRCTSANCTWPTFESLSICHKCQQISPVIVNPVNFTRVLQEVKGNTSLALSTSNTLDFGHEVMVGDIGPVYVPLGGVYGDHTTPGDEWLDLLLAVDTVWKVGNLSGFVADIDKFGWQSTNILGFKDPLTVIGFSKIEWSELGANMDNTTVCALDFCLRQFTVSMVENRPQVEHGDIRYGTKLVEERLSPNGSWSTLCWKPDGSEDAQYIYSASLLKSDVCPYDPHTFAFCGCSMFLDFGWNRMWDIFEGIGGNGTYPPDLGYMESNDRWVLNTSESYWSEWNDIVAENRAYGPGIIEDSSAEYGRLYYELGLERFTANLADALTNILQENSWSNIEGSTISMVPQVQVRWQWLALPALLNLAAAIFLALTMWINYQHRMPLWKTSLVASFFHGLEQDLQGKNSDVRVSQMNQEADHLHVRLKRSEIPGKMIFSKGD